MNDKMPTRRKIQAESTRKKIYDISIALMEKKGLANTTIVEISKKAGVSVGTFYNYFASKDDIFIDIFRKADDYFQGTVAKNLKNTKAKTSVQVVLYFKYYARYVQRRGLANIAQLYNGRNKFFAIKGRYMQELLKELIRNGQINAELSSQMTPDEITEYLFIAGRGVVFDWCVHEAGYNLEEKMTAYMKKLVPIFLKKRNS
jgi:TetR/AcrR family fatty acid metabolism transcriptional regulator